MLYIIINKTGGSKMKYTKKQIADEYNCMISVNGLYPEGNAKIKDALIKAEEEIDRRSVSCQINNRRREIINEAYDILTTSQAREDLKGIATMR
jgi:dsDNA-binding SOS-regulon protein